MALRHSAHLLSSNTDGEVNALKKAQLKCLKCLGLWDIDPAVRTPKLLRYNRPEEKDRIILESDVCRYT